MWSNSKIDLPVHVYDQQLQQQKERGKLMIAVIQCLAHPKRQVLSPLKKVQQETSPSVVSKFTDSQQTKTLTRRSSLRMKPFPRS